MYWYCFGIRLDQNYQELTCKAREHCPYYVNTDLSVALANQDKYQELDTYNNEECKYNKI